MIVFGKHRRAKKNLSAYADGELSLKDRQALEAHLEACERCRLALDGLRRTMGVLRSLPDVQPRRSFALTPEMVTRARPEPSPGPARALTYGTRLAAAGLAAALVIVFAIDVSDMEDNRDSSEVTVNYAAERDPSALDDAADGSPPEATTIPETAGTLAPLSTQGPGAAGGGVGGVSAETPVAGGGAAGDEERLLSDGEEVAAESPAVGAADAGTDGASNEAENDDVLRDVAVDGDAGDGESSEQSTPLNGDGGSGTLLAIEIGLGAAFAVVLTVAVWLTFAARQRETRP